MKRFLLLLRKDLTIELRGREMLYSLGTLSLLIAVFFSVGIQNAFIEPKAISRILPTLICISFVFAATLTISRSLAYESDTDAFGGLSCAGIPLCLLYASKVVVNSLLCLASFLVISTTLVGLLGINTPGGFSSSLFIVGGLVSVAYSALAVLMCSMVLSTKLRDLLLPLILFPMLFPLFFAGHELIALAIAAEPLADAPWLSLLVLIDLIYLGLGSHLFRFVIRG